MIPFILPISQGDVNYVRGADAYVHRIRGHEAVCVATAACGVVDGAGLSDSVEPVLSPLEESTAIAADEGSTSVSIPDREWTPAAKKRLDKLVMKAALKTITQEERLEMRDLQSIRRENAPGRTYEDIMRTAELDRRLENLKKALEEYVNYLPC